MISGDLSKLSFIPTSYSIDSERHKLLTESGFPFASLMTEDLLKEAYTIPVNNFYVAGDVVAAMLYARTTGRQLVPGSIPWKEMEKLVQDLNLQTLEQTLQRCFRSEVNIEMSYCFYALLNMAFDTGIILPELASCNFQELNDELHGIYMDDSLENFFFRGTKDADFSRFPDQVKWITFLRLFASDGDIARWAAKEGSIGLFEEICRQAPDHYDWEYHELATQAVKSGKIEMLQHIIGKAPKNIDLLYSSLASEAIENRDLTFLKFIMEKFAPRHYEWNYEKLSYMAAEKGDVQSLEYILEHGCSGCWIWKRIAENAAQSGSVEMLKFVFIKANLHETVNWDYRSLTYFSGFSGNLDLVKFIVDLEEKIDMWDFNLAAMGSASVDVLRFIMSLAPKDYAWNFNLLLEEAAHFGHLDVLKYLLTIVPSGYKLPPNLYNMAMRSRNRKVFNLINRLSF